MSAEPTSKPAKKPTAFAMVAEYKNPHAILEAMKIVRQAGYSHVDTHTPFPIHGMDAAMGLRQSRLPWLCFGGGMAGVCTAVYVQWYMNAFDYPFRVAGKPFFSYQAYVPVAFELTVLLAAFCAVLGMFALTGLPQHYHPLFNHPRFGRCTDDAFILSVQASDPKWDEAQLRKVLEGAGGSEITVVSDAPEAAHG